MARVAIVTGGTRGIGEAISVALKDMGMNVAANYAGNDERAREFTDRTGIPAYKWDVSDFEACQDGVKKIEADLGPIDVLVNNAGVDLTGALHELPAEKIEELVAVNLVAPMLLCRAVLPAMWKRGRGHILNVSSLAGTNALPGVLPYSASKAGLSHFTAGLRAECKGTPVTTTLAEIGPVESSMMDSLRSHEPTRKAVARLSALKLSVDLDLDKVVAALVEAIRTEKRHVRMPARDIMFPALVEAPRRITEFLLAGVN